MQQFPYIIYPGQGWREVLACPCRRRMSFRRDGGEFYFLGIFSWLVHSIEWERFLSFWLDSDPKSLFYWWVSTSRWLVLETKSIQKFECLKLDNWFVLKSTCLEYTSKLSQHDTLGGSKLMWMSGPTLFPSLVVRNFTGVRYFQKE